MKRLLLLALLAVTSLAPATTIIQTFNDIADVALNNNLALIDLDSPGGVGFTSGYQQSNTRVPVIVTNDLIVALANYVSGQAGATQHWSVMAVTNSSGLARRTQTRATPSMTGTIWFSFLASLRSTNGETALTFNGGWGVNGTPNANTGGFRVGLGHSSTASVRGALGVGPLTTASGEATLATIVNGVNGAVTPPNFVPTDGTPGLVLGCFDTDPTTFYPRVRIWYNPDVPNEASLPAPTLTFVDSSYAIVPTEITRIGYQVVRSATLGVFNEMIDNVKVSNEPTGFDIVYKNAPLPIPVVTTVGTVLFGSENGPTNLVFTLNTDKPVSAPLTIYYTLSGVATNGWDGIGGFISPDYTDTNFNYGFSSVTIPAGQSSARVVVAVVDDALPEGNESVIFTPQSSTDYILASGSTLTGYILDNNDANVSLQYMFTRTLAPQVWDTNIVAANAVVAGIGAGSYSGAYFISPDAAYSAGGNNTAADAAGAIANGDYMGLTLAPVPGRALTLTNLNFMAIYGNYLYQVPTATGAVVFVRSSLDNFTTNLAEFVLLPDNLVFPNAWYSNHVALGSQFSQLAGQIEFRLYIYDDSDHNQVGVRIDNLYFNGVTQPLPAGVNQVNVSTNVINAAEPATPGQFTLVRFGDASNPLTVNYTIAGTATSGADYTALSGTATFAAGQSTATVTVTPLDDDLVEPSETVVLTLAPGSGYSILPPSSATLSIADNGDIGGLVAYFFNESNNGAGSLAAAAAPSFRPGSPVAALNATAGAGLGAFGQFVGNNSLTHGYATSVTRSAPSTLYIANGVLGTNAAAALQGDDYISFTLAPQPGYALTLTNFSAWLMLRPTEGQTNWVFLRSSLDNFAADLGAFAIGGTTNNSPEPFREWSTPLNVAAYPGAIEFRVYVFSSRSGVSDVFRMDDVTFQGQTVAAPAGSQVVSVTASDATAAEPGSDPGAFTFTRSGSTAAPLVVTYAVDGTAVNGVDYTLLNGPVSFAAGQSTVLVPVAPVDDNRPEPTETVSVTLLPSASYYISLPSTATVSLLDDGDTTPVFTFAASDTNAYERVPELLGAFTLTRVAGETTTSQTLNFTLAGSAVLGVDYLSSATNAVTFDPGATTQTIQIIPLNNNLADGDRTVILTVQTSPSFILDPPHSGIVTIVDDEVPPETVLWSDNFDAGTSAGNYTVTAGSDLGIDDYTADFAFDYSAIGLPPAPGATTTIGLMVNANAYGAAAGVNFYPTGRSFSGDYALRFNLYVSMDPLAGSDNEAAYFGLNQTGLATNWLASVGTGNPYTNHGEGVWATVATRDGTPGLCTILATPNSGAPPVMVATTGSGVYFPHLFNSPPYAMSGRPNNAYDSTNKTWVDCELSQVGGLITLKLNNNILLQYTNTTPFTSGNVFIGYGDPFATLGSVNCFAIFDNVRVVRLAAAPVPPRITAIHLVGATVEITFTAALADPAAAFKLQSAAGVAGAYADDNTATLTALGGGQFKATTVMNGAARFYRIRR